MPALFIYLIKANIALTLFYLVYRFGLRRLTFYTLNRYFLLLGIIGAAVLPLVDIQTLFNAHHQVADNITFYTINWYTLQQSTTAPDTFTIWPLLRAIFYTGAVVMFVRFTIQLASLLRIHLQSLKTKLCDEKVNALPLKINPFSFFKNIYINPELYSDDEIRTILAHEKIHAEQWHSIDILVAELQHIFYWFNPGAWLIKKAIRENLEFITDRSLLRSGINTKAYQYTLLNATTSMQKTRLANNFNFIHIKKRIMMMNKKKSPRLHLLRYLLIFPATVVIVLLVSFTHRATDQASPDSLPRQNKGIAAPMNWHTFLNQDSVLSGTHAPAKTGEYPATGINYSSATSVKDTQPAIKRATSNTAEDTIPFAKDGNALADRGFEALKHKDWKNAERYAQQALKTNPTDKSAKGILAYAQEVMAFKRRQEAYAKKQKNISSGKITGAAKAGTIHTPEEKKSWEGRHPLLVLNGEVVEGLEPNLLPVGCKDIEKLYTLKDSAAILKYGKRGENGAFEVITTDYAVQHPEVIAEHKQFSGFMHIPDNAQILVDNEVMDSTFSIKDLKKEDIYMVFVFKGDNVPEEKDPKAHRNGFVKITTKEYHQIHPGQ